jgi:hypothetical protein
MNATLIFLVMFNPKPLLLLKNIEFILIIIMVLEKYTQLIKL